jgi:AmmeMemoRadiSam system protein B
MAENHSNALTRQAATPWVRRPAVAEYFYPSEPGALRAALDLYRPELRPSARPLAVVAPHGSFRWAGQVIGSVLGRVALPARCILLGPSHTGRAGGWSLMAGGAYESPLGEVPVNEDLAISLQERCPFLATDETAQQGEHAIEVLVPFLQRYGSYNLSIVPIICGGVDPVERVQLAGALAELVRTSTEPVLLIASSDLTHYEPVARAESLDRMLVDRIAALDPDGVLRASREHGAKMCGDDAVACVVQAAALLGATGGAVTARATSAANGGDPDSAIGYAGVIIT